MTFTKLFPRSVLALFILAFVCSHTFIPSAFAKAGPKKSEISETVKRALKEFYTPAMSVGVVHKGKVVMAQGFGYADIENQQKADADTYFRLASTSKAFTASALAILVDEGLLSWNDKVVEHLPDFQLYDPYVTAEFTILDLLTHRSGLVSGAGDSMIWPEPSGFSREEVIHNLRYLTPEYSFRARYAYSNVMYITAGEVVAKLSGMSFDDFIEKRVFKPLNMNCYSGDMPPIALANSAKAYGHSNERGIYEIPRNGINGKKLMSAAAGGMVCSANGMIKWMQALLSKKGLPFSNTQLEAMFSPQTILGVSRIEREWDNTFFKSYGLGWRLDNIGALKVISHTGTLSGYQAYVVLIPELELGVSLLNNGSYSAARGSVMQSIIKRYLNDYGYTDQESVDWINTYINYMDEREQAYLARQETPEASLPMLLSLDDIEGEYKDRWFGSLILKMDGDKMRIYSSRMKTLVGSVSPFQASSFKVDWDNTNAAGPAFMHFETDIKNKIISASLHPFSTRIFSNHAYRDMTFYPVTEPSVSSQ